MQPRQRLGPVNAGGEICKWNVASTRQVVEARRNVCTRARNARRACELDDVLDDAESEFALNKTLVAYPEPRRGEAIVDEGGRGMASSELREIA